MSGEGYNAIFVNKKNRYFLLARRKSSTTSCSTTDTGTGYGYTQIIRHTYLYIMLDGSLQIATYLGASPGGPKHTQPGFLRPRLGLYLSFTTRST